MNNGEPNLFTNSDVIFLIAIFYCVYYVCYVFPDHKKWIKFYMKRKHDMKLEKLRMNEDRIAAIRFRLQNQLSELDQLERYNEKVKKEFYGQKKID